MVSGYPYETFYISIMKGDITLKILSTLAKAASEAAIFVEVLLTAPYGSSLGRMNAIDRSIRRRDAHIATERERAHRYRVLIYKLKRDGLIEERASGDRRVLYVTSRGQRKIKLLQSRSAEQMPATNYVGEASDRFVIVSFDVPETERRKRAWLRSALRSLGLRMIQKSVWIGKKKLPESFLDDLKQLRLLDYVEVFEITKGGTLRHVA